MEELQPYGVAVNPLADPTQPSLPAHHAWLPVPQLLSHTLSSAPVYLDDASPVLLLAPPSAFQPLLATAVDHTAPPSLAESSSPAPMLTLSMLTLPFVPLVPTAAVRCVGYRFVERRLAVGQAVLVIGRAVRGEDGAVVMTGGRDSGGGKELRVERGGEESAKRVARESREDEWGLEVLAVASGVVGCLSLCWHYWQRSDRIRKELLAVAVR